MKTKFKPGDKCVITKPMWGTSPEMRNAVIGLKIELFGTPRSVGVSHWAYEGEASWRFKVKPGGGAPEWLKDSSYTIQESALKKIGGGFAEWAKSHK